jgi:hypothetical protein
MNCYGMGVKANEALDEVIRMATQGRYILTSHARLRSRERGGVRERDIRHALVNATSCREDRDPNHASDWKVEGPDMDGDDLTLCVIIEDDVVVCTVF